MTTVMIKLPAEPIEVPPLLAEPGPIRTCASDLLAASAQIDDLGTFASGSARVADWQGAAAASYHQAVTPAGEQADAMSLALRGVARRVDAHAEEMTVASRQRVELVESRTWTLRWFADLREQIAAAGDGVAPAEMVRLEQEAERLREAVRSFNQSVSDWSADVTTEETAMVRAFERLQTLSQIEQSYGGQPDPADGALATMPSATASAETVNAWWDGLTSEQQLAIIAASPGSVGNRDGIPASARSAANSVSLDRDLAALGTMDPDLLTDEEKRRLEIARSADAARQNIEGRIDPATGEPITAQIYSYDPGAFDGDGKVAISAGNLDTADNVTVMVPGLGTDATSADFYSNRAATLYEGARFLDPSQTNATMFWIGYDAPDNLPWDGGWDAVGVTNEALAERGGEELSRTIDGLRAGRDGEDAHLTALGHSYGSTTTAHGGSDHGLDVDDMILVGSPGAGGDNDHASDLGMDPDHVWAGANSRDLVADLGNHGSFHLETFGGVGLGDDPAEDDFGANRFQAESTTRGESSNPMADHSKYFDHNSESLYNITQIVNGNYDAVNHAGHVTDPWYTDPQDPEFDRDPTSPRTEGP